VLQCVAVWCSVFQCVAMCCSALQCLTHVQWRNTHARKLLQLLWEVTSSTHIQKLCEWMHLCSQHICATRSNTLQRTAAQCNSLCSNMLQHAATRCNTLQHTATHCNTLQHTATNCNTLQHTVAHCCTMWEGRRHRNIYCCAISFKIPIFYEVGTQRIRWLVQVAL